MKWFGTQHSGAPGTRSENPPEQKPRAKLRIGIPKILNVWTTHQFWLGFFGALGVPNSRVIFSQDTTEEQGKTHGKGRGTVDCCYPVK